MITIIEQNAMIRILNQIIILISEIGWVMQRRSAQLNTFGYPLLFFALIQQNWSMAIRINSNTYCLLVNK